MLTHVLLGMTPIGCYLAYIASSRHTSKGAKTAAQDAIVMLEAITVEVNSKFRKLMRICLTKLNVYGLACYRRSEERRVASQTI